MIQSAFMVMKTHWETSGEHQSIHAKFISYQTPHLVFFLRLLFSALPSNSCNKRMSRREIKVKAVNTECDFCALHFRQKDNGED
jgi:hypothetical protein